MRSTKSAVLIAATLGLMAAATVATPVFASGQGSQNTAIALGAGAAYELSQHHTGAGLLLGLGAVIAENQAQNQFANEDCNNGSYYVYGGDRGRDHYRDYGDRDGGHDNFHDGGRDSDHDNFRGGRDGGR